MGYTFDPFSSCDFPRPTLLPLPIRFLGLSSRMGHSGLPRVKRNRQKPSLVRQSYAERRKVNVAAGPTIGISISPILPPNSTDDRSLNWSSCTLLVDLNRGTGFLRSTPFHLLDMNSTQGKQFAHSADCGPKVDILCSVPGFVKRSHPCACLKEKGWTRKKHVI